MRWIFYFLLLVNIIYFSRSIFLQNNAPIADNTNKQAELSVLELSLQKAVPQQPSLVEGIDVAEDNSRYLNLSLQPEAKPEVTLTSSAYETSLLDTALEKHCLVLGPYEQDQHGAINKFLQQRQIEHESKATADEIVTGYWVYIDEGFSRDSATHYMKNLKKRGIDSYVIGNGPLENRVSMGLFKAPENAVNRQKQLIKDGFQNVNVSPRVKKIQRNEAEIVLYGDVAFDSLKNYLVEKNLDIKINENTCI